MTIYFLVGFRLNHLLHITHYILGKEINSITFIDVPLREQPILGHRLQILLPQLPKELDFSVRRNRIICPYDFKRLKIQRIE
ncbi:hypothetical protein WS55_27625 [Burkholderia pseudomultivorans]|nr:hypothetical protein WS56_08640 [Burkholderia pseudomultivorans]KVC38549.1 hypothetical protein WS55_27625 [Burkholderia pseudomultivorans]